MNRFMVRLLATLLFIPATQGCREGNPPGDGDRGAIGSGVVPGTDTGRYEKGNPPINRSAVETARTGIVRGRVLLKGPSPERRKALVVKDVAVCRKIDHLDDRLVVGNDGGIRNAVVSVRGVSDGRTLSSMGAEFTLDQRTCAYSPHIVLVPVGATLNILNSDGILHNIHTYSTANPAFNIAQPKVLRTLHKAFSSPERIGVKCDVHGWMSSWVIVVDHPYYVVTDEHGEFELADVPPGRYTVECWQEELGELTATVSVGEGPGKTTHDFVYSRPGTAAKN